MGIEFEIHIKSDRSTHIVEQVGDAKSHLWLPEEYRNAMVTFLESLQEIERRNRRQR